MPKVYAFGNNAFRQTDPSAAEINLLEPRLVWASKNSPTWDSSHTSRAVVIGTCWSQTAVACNPDDPRSRANQSPFQTWGLGLQSKEGILSAGPESGIDNVPSRFIGKENFTSVLRSDGYILECGASGTRQSLSRFADVVADGHGNLALLTEDRRSVQIHSHVTGNRLRLEDVWDRDLDLTKAPRDNLLPGNERVTALEAGSNFFLLLTSSGQVYSHGDDRFSQLGRPSNTSCSSSSSSKSRSSFQQIPFFEGLNVRSIQCGGFHSAAITDSEDLYLWGSDREYQCGGFGSGSGEPTLVDFEADGDGDGAEGGDGQPSVIAVGCGSAHTVVATESGVFASGANHSGQLGLGDKEPRQTFTRIPFFDRHTVLAVDCSQWNTFVTVADSP